jgi:hypothetical protein
MSVPDSTGPVNAPTACFEEPQNVSAKATYFKDFATRMKNDAHYTGIVVKIDAGLDLIGKYELAIIAALPGTKGKVAFRNTCEKKMKSSMKNLLSEVQVVCDDDPENAVSHIESLGISYRTREAVTKEAIEIRCGKVSGTFVLLVRKPKGKFAVLWEITTTPDDSKSWKTADFSHNTHGFIEGLMRGTTYYFRAKTSSSVTGKSDWTQVFDILCN